MSNKEIEKAGPAYSKRIGQLIHQTGPDLWNYLFESDSELFDRYIGGLWALENNSFAHSEAVVLRDTDSGDVCGLELGFTGKAKKDLKKSEPAALMNILSQQELISLDTRSKGIGYLTPYVPPNAYYLKFFSIDPSCQGQGLGRVLMENCIRRATELNCKSIHLDVTTDNPAINIYKAFGFRIAVEVRLPEKEVIPPLYRMVKDL